MLGIFWVGRTNPVPEQALESTLAVSKLFCCVTYSKRRVYYSPAVPPPRPPYWTGSFSLVGLASHSTLTCCLLHRRWWGGGLTCANRVTADGGVTERRVDRVTRGRLSYLHWRHSSDGVSVCAELTEEWRRVVWWCTDGTLTALPATALHREAVGIYRPFPVKYSTALAPQWCTHALIYGQSLS